MPKRRWYQFSLRTMFMGMTLTAIGCVIVPPAIKWYKLYTLDIDDMLQSKAAQRNQEPQPDRTVRQLSGLLSAG